MKRILAIVAVIAVGIYAVVCWGAALRLLAPPRKAFGAIHREMVVDLREHGIRIRRDETPAGVPYLLCDRAGASCGPRGEILRDQLRMAGWPQAAFGANHGSIVLLHGWGMRKEDLLRTAERFCAVGYRCLIPDLPGHGDNPAETAGFGAKPGEEAIACDVLDDAARKYRFEPRPAALWGMSMGGAYAISAAAANPGRWDVLVVVCTFDELEPVILGQARKHLGGWAGILQPGFDAAVRIRGGFWPGSVRPVSRIPRATGVATMIVHGDADDLIPIEAGRRIFTAAGGGSCGWVRVAGAGHGNVLGTPQHVFAAMADWLLRHSAADSKKL